MSSKLLLWHIFEITSKRSSLNGVMLRGRIRKFGIENNINVLVENSEDRENSVRFAVLNKSDADKVTKYLNSIIDNLRVEPALVDVQNPVLSKLKVNIKSRYSI